MEEERPDGERAPRPWLRWIGLGILGAVGALFKTGVLRHVFDAEPEPSLNEFAEAREHLEQIEAERANAEEATWTGEFEFGRQDRCRLDVAERGGFVLRVKNGRSETEYALCAWGDVEPVDERTFRLVHTHTRSNEPPDRRVHDVDWLGEGTELMLVPWGARDYLVPRSSLPEFCQVVNGGWEWKHADESTFPRRRHNRRSSGFGDPPPPEVPEAWRPLLLSSEVQAQVTEAEREPVPENVIDVGQSSRTRVSIDAGSDRGLRIGTRVYCKVPGTVAVGEIDEIESDRARAWLRHGVLSPSQSRPPGPGDRVSTRRPD